MSKETECPHGIEKRKYVPIQDFDPYTSASARHFVILDAEWCPSCLVDRVQNLRKALDLILSGCARPALCGELRSKFEEGLSLYYADLKEHL